MFGFLSRVLKVYPRFKGPNFYMNEKVTVEEMTVDGRGPPQSPQYKSTVATPLQPIWFLKRSQSHTTSHITTDRRAHRYGSRVDGIFPHNFCLCFVWFFGQNRHRYFRFWKLFHEASNFLIFFRQRGINYAIYLLCAEIYSRLFPQILYLVIRFFNINYL